MTVSHFPCFLWPWQFCRLSFNCTSSDVLLMSRLGLWVFERKTTEVKCPSHHIISGSTNVLFLVWDPTQNPTLHFFFHVSLVSFNLWKVFNPSLSFTTLTLCQEYSKESFNLGLFDVFQEWIMIWNFIRMSEKKCCISYQGIHDVTVSYFTHHHLVKMVLTGYLSTL